MCQQSLALDIVMLTKLLATSRSYFPAVKIPALAINQAAEEKPTRTSTKYNLMPSMKATLLLVHSLGHSGTWNHLSLTIPHTMAQLL